MSSDDSDAALEGRKRKLRHSEASGSSRSSGSPIIGNSSRFKRKTSKAPKHLDTSDDSDSDNSIPHVKIKRKKALILSSDSEGSSTGSDIVIKKGTARIHSESDNGFSGSSSEWESSPSDNEQSKLDSTSKSLKKPSSGSDSDSSLDAEAEKCPICLLRFKAQQIGTPESCDHRFCLECLQEWSKNMNTCPVDRKEYTLILVRDNLESVVIRRIEIEKPQPQNDADIVEDPTFCEICGSSENEDRLLLCDGCDLGFHLYCLTPRLDAVPLGAWYCNECSPDEDVETEIELVELQMLIDNAEESLASLEDIIQQQGRRRRNRSARLVPRTQQTERVRRRIVNNRNLRSFSAVVDLDRPSTSSGIEDSQLTSYNAVSSTSSTLRSSKPKRKNTKTKTKRKYTKKKKYSRKKSTSTRRHRIVYEIDEITGEAVAVVKKQGRSSKPKKSRKKRRLEYVRSIPKTVKRRLAAQLGICAPRNVVPQELPAMRVQSSTRNLTDLRHQAGIPTLRIFGQNNQLDYFSGSDDEPYEYGGSSLLTRRAPNNSDVAALRRAARRKAAVVNVPNAVSSTTDILGSILDTQEKLHSRNTVFSVDTSSGKIKMDKKDSEGIRKRPTGGNKSSQGSYNPPQNVDYSSDYQFQSHSSYYNFCSNFEDTGNNAGPYSYGGNEQYDMPQDYTRRTLCEAELMQDFENKPDEHTPVSESDLDIYSDMESEAVSTSRVYEPLNENDFMSHLRPLPRPPSPPEILLRTPNTDDDNDSESGMVIDTEKTMEENREDMAVTSTVGFMADAVPEFGPVIPQFGPVASLNTSMELQSEAVQSSSRPEEREEEEFEGEGCPNASIYAKQDVSETKNNDEDEYSNDGCPNFSIYSRESKNVAMTTDIAYQAPEPPEMQQYNPEEPIEEGEEMQQYNPEEPLEECEEMQQYNPEEPIEEVEEPPEMQEYNPEKPIEEGKEMRQYSPEKPIECGKEMQQYSPEEPVEEGELPATAAHVQYEFSSRPLAHENVDRAPLLAKPFILQRKNESLGALGLYSDSEDESVVKKTLFADKDSKKKKKKKKKKRRDLSAKFSDESANAAFGISDIKDMTEDILSEEERSYTPCLDERMEKTRAGLEGLDTELISDEERNDFDESHELKTVSEGDALEINAKESELDFTRPEDYEEGEIVDKNKDKDTVTKEPEESLPDKGKEEKKKDTDKEDKEAKSKKKKDKNKDRSDTEHDKTANKENEEEPSSFKKPSKSTKERHYRDKDREKSRTKSPEKPTDREKEKDKESRRRKEKRKELERYNVRALIAEKPRPPPKDKFGRDLIRHTPSRSKTRSKSYTPPIIPRSPSNTRRSLSKTRRSPSQTRRSPSGPRLSPPMPQRSASQTRRSISRYRNKSPSKDREKTTRKRGRSRSKQRHRSVSRSRSPRKRSRSKNKKQRKRSRSRGEKRRRSKERTKSRKRPRSRSRLRSGSVGTPPRRRRPLRDWTPSFSRSPTADAHRMSPSWTPPRTSDKTQSLRNKNLTVILNNDSGKKKRERRRKTTDKRREPIQKKRRRERERTPPPSKEVFASGDNILVSVSFNNENETRDISTRDKRKKDAEKDKKKEKRKTRQKKDLSGVKPIAIIDLERSPFQEIPSSPKDIIVLSDSDNNETENNRQEQENICDSSEQVASPERITNYTTGPKTPPEPQVKFSLNVKPPQMRAITNPLHEADEHNDEEEEELMQEEMEEEDLNTSGAMHKGPNTPPEPPNSPPSSPDVYDPFEPTKSRSPTPEPSASLPVSQNKTTEDIRDDVLDNRDNNRSAVIDVEKAAQSPDILKSLTPPVADIQPADSQSSIQVTPDSNVCKSPDQKIGVVINQQITQTPQPATKPVAQTTPFSSVPTSIVTSTPISSTLAPARINILSSTLITPPHLTSSIPQRIVLPNQVKSSPVKISPTKAAVKSTPIKPMQSKTVIKSATKKRGQNVINLDSSDNIDFDSPYSPGSSDYEDLFEPPTEIINFTKTTKTAKSTNKVAPQKPQSAFDSLFGSPIFSSKKKHNDKNSKPMFGKKSLTPSKTKQVGVKIDEDSLKILEDLPNSAVEMQVKDKFLKKLNRQERVVEEVKLVLKPYYNKKKINKEEYKDIMRRAVPKICHNKSGEINPTKIKHLVEAYVKKIKHSKKVTSSSSIPQKGLV